MDFAWLEALFPDNIADTVAFAIGCPVSAVYTQAARRRLAKSPEHLAEMGALHAANLVRYGAGRRFKKGQVPPNKGRFGYHAPGAEKGWFKKGHQRNDTAPVGAERVCSKEGYILVKVADRGGYALPWRAKQRLVWEQHHGPIPAGHIVTFRDRNKLNCDIDNLVLITKAENMRRNTIHNYPEPIKKAILTLGQLKRRINERDKCEQQ